MSPSPVSFRCHCYRRYKPGDCGQFGEFLIFLGISEFLVIFWCWRPRPCSACARCSGCDPPSLPPVLLLGPCSLPEAVSSVPSPLCGTWKSISRCLICCFECASKNGIVCHG